MDSTSQQTVVGLDLTNFIRGIARNSEIAHNAPKSATNVNGFLRVPQEGDATLLKFGGEGETEDESVVVSDSEEVGEARGRAPTVIEFDTESFIENVRELPCLWNTSLASYKDRNNKLNAWKQLSSLFNRDSEYIN